MSDNVIDFAFGGAMATLLAVCGGAWAWQALTLHRRLRNIRRHTLPAPWDGAIAGRTGKFYVQCWDRHDKWDAAVRGRIVGTPRIRR